MNNTRQTQTIEANGHTIEMYTFINTLENRKLTEILSKNAVIGSDGQVTNGFTIADLYEAQDYIIGAMVVSLDGEKDNIGNRILELPKDEGDAVYNAINSALNLDIGSKKKIGAQYVYEQMLNGITPSSDLKSEVSDVFVVSVCRNMGWTYDDYINAPQWFVDVLEGMILLKKKSKDKTV